MTIAPGYFECRSRIRFGRPVDMPGVGHVMMPDSRICGVKYHGEGLSSSDVVCACGTFAIGLCAVCKTPICGDHSRLDRLRRCDACIVNEAKREADARRQEHAKALADLAAVDDPIERLVSSIRYLEVVERGEHPERERIRLGLENARVRMNELRTLCPDPWSPNSVAIWFCERAMSSGIEPGDSWIRYYTKQKYGFFGPYIEFEDTPIPAWVFDGGSATLIQRDSEGCASALPGMRWDAGIIASHNRRYWDGIVTVTGQCPFGLRDTALADIARILDLPTWMSVAKAVGAPSTKSKKLRDGKREGRR